MIRRRSGFREKIAVLVALPVAVVVLAGVPLLAAQMEVARGAGAARDSARTAVEVAPLLRSLAAERLLSVAGVAGDVRPRAALLARQAESRQLTDAALRGLADLPAPGAREALVGLAGLEPVRAAVLGRTASARDIVGRYGDAIGAVVAGARLDGGRLDGARLDGTGTGAALLVVQARDTMGAAVLWAAADPAAAVDAALAATDASASAALYARGLDATGGPAASRAAVLAASPPERAVDGLVRALRADPGAFAVARQESVVDLLSVTTAAAVPRGMTLGNVLAEAAASSADRARVSALVALAIGIVLLCSGVCVVVVGLRIATSVSRPLRALAAAAGEVADLAGRELLRVADTEDVGVDAPALAAVNVAGDDELGDLAGAFNRVQAAAALLLERQVLIRRSSAGMLGHVGRRTRTLVARQLSIIDSLEQSEQDAERLERLYRLDHVTCRLRRNADSLLVLAAAGEHDLGDDPQPVADVIRSAITTIEGYQRVSLAGVLDARVRPSTQADVALMIAELVENAVTFSPPGTAVVVGAVASAGGGCRVRITDQGVGMPAAEMAHYNERLRSPERLELGPVDVLGLLVVGRIARRHAISVTLVPSPATGVTALVDLPSALLIGNPAEPRHGARPAAAEPAVAVAEPGLVRRGAALRAAAVPDPVAWSPPPERVQRKALAPPVSNGYAGRFENFAPARGLQTGSNGRNGHAVPGVPPPAAPPSLPAGGPPATPRPAGAHGLHRRVPGAQSPAGVEPARPAPPPLLGMVADPEEARRFVEELEAGVARAVEQVRAEQARLTIEENRDV
jgi:signal transduction histidine kinase